MADRRAHTANLQSPLQRTVQTIAEDLLGRKVGDKVRTAVEYQQLSGVGSGTVQRALSTIEASGAVTLSRHGHRGTEILRAHPGLLWTFAGRSQVRIAVPIPGAVDVFGLSKGLRAEFDRLDIPSDLTYVAGSGSRAQFVSTTAADVAVMSKSASRQLPEDTARGLELIDLSEGTFYGHDSLTLLERAGAPVSRDGPIRVGRIYASDDHVRLTAAEFPPAPNITYVDLPYMSLPNAVLQGEVDIGVWHRALMPAPLATLGLDGRPLSNPKITDVLDTMSAASLVVRSEDAALLQLFNQVSLDAVEQVQKELKALDPSAPESLELVWGE